MRDTAHVDGGQDGVADGAVLEQRFAGAHGLVVAHILIHGQNDTGGFACLNSLDCFGIICAQRFLGQNAFGRAARTGGLYDLELVIRWHGEIKYLDGFIIKQPIDGVVHGVNIVRLSAGGGVGLRATGNGDGIEAGLAIGNEVAVAHDKTAADAANAPVFPLGKFRMNVEVHLEAFSPAPVVASAAGSQKSVLLSNSLAPMSLMAESGSFSSGA